MHRKPSVSLSLIMIGSFMLLGGCGSSDTDQKSTTTSTAETAPGPDSGAVDCVAEGAAGNEKGIGKYCQASAECPGTTFCTAGLAPKGAEYCTSFCSTDADCGSGAVCYTDPRGKGCAPAKCVE